MNEEKDYLYHFWHNDTDEWLKEFAYLAKDNTLKGLTIGGLTDSERLVNLAYFDLERLMCAQDIIRCYLGPSSGRYNKFNEYYSSYYLKHMIETLLCRVTHGRINYISNGTLILAMYHCGYKFQKIYGTPNCIFNVPKKSYKRLSNTLSDFI